MADRITITVKNWHKHNPRKDIKHPSWFAMSNRILEDPDFFDFTDSEWRAVLYIFSQASQKNSPTVTLVVSHADQVCRVKPATLARTLDKLAAIGCVQVTLDPRTESERDTTLQDKTDTTRQDKQDSTSSCTVVAVPAPLVPDESPNGLVDFKSELEVLRSIPDKTRERWIALYPDPDFLRREALKAFNWYDNNPVKKPKTIRGWVRALSSWFEKGWRFHVKTIDAKAGSGIDWNQVFAKPGDVAV